MSLIGRFSFKRVGRSPFGPIDRPLVDVFFQAQDGSRVVPVKMIIDTGADYTLLPARYTDLLGISIKRECGKSISQGIGGRETVYLFRKKIKVFINRWSTEIPLGFLQRDDMPPLLGRLLCLEKISLLMRRKVAFLGR